MKEKDLQAIFGKKNTIHGVFELKMVKGPSKAFNEVEDHQIEALLRVSGHEGVYHKVADQTIGRKGEFGASLKKPFDCFFLKNTPAFVVPIWYVPRKRKTAYYIPIKWFLNMREDALNGILDGRPRKSFTEDMARAFSEYVVELQEKKKS